MTVVEALNALKTFLEKEVASTIELQKEESDPVEYVHPYVAIISMPHKNFMPVNYQVPCILVGLVNGDDTDEEHKANIRIACATYGGDVRFQEANNIPDEKGYMDLLNLIERIKLKLIEEKLIEGKCIVEKPVNYGLYDEQITYPYWYGYLQFPIQMPVTQTTKMHNPSTYKDLL